MLTYFKVPMIRDDANVHVQDQNESSGLLHMWVRCPSVPTVLSSFYV